MSREPQIVDKAISTLVPPTRLPFMKTNLNSWERINPVPFAVWVERVCASLLARSPSRGRNGDNALGPTAARRARSAGNPGWKLGASGRIFQPPVQH